MAKVRVSQAWLEVVTQDDSDLRVSQALIEVAAQGPSVLRVSQAMLEVIVDLPVGPDQPTVTASNVAETSVDLASSAYSQGASSSAVHESSRWLVINENTDEIEYDSGEDLVDLLSHSVPAGSIPSNTDLLGGCMHKNDADEWSYYPGITDSFTTLAEDVEASAAIEFWTGDDSGPIALISRHGAPSTTDTSYLDWIRDENIPVPLTTRYIIPIAWKIGSDTNDIRIKEVQIDKGRLSGGYHPTGFRPELHTISDIPASGADIGAIAASTFDIDWLNGDVATVKLDLSSTMTWSNIEPYRDYYLIVEQGAGGSFLLTWPSTAKFAGGTAPTLTTTAGAKDVFKLIAESASIVHVHTLALDSK